MPRTNMEFLVGILLASLCLGFRVEELSKPLFELPGPSLVKTLIEEDFENSWGQPAVVDYTPPDVNFTHVQLRLNASVNGRQFDRLGHLFLDDHEIWRTSTAEPRGPKNVTAEWSFDKDVSMLANLFKKDRKLSFYLGNTVDDKLTGVIHIRIDATFINVAPPDDDNGPPPPDHKHKHPHHFAGAEVIAIAPSGKDVPLWYLPQDEASVSDIKLPKNTSVALLQITATGNADEEDWFSNLEDQFQETFGKCEHHTHGPHREIRVYVDDHLAGVAFPIPGFYSGSVSPSLWSPLVAFGTFDIHPYFIDLSPFLPLLWDGAKLSIEIDNGRGELGRDWIVSGNLISWQRHEDYKSGEILSINEGRRYDDVKGKVGEGNSSLFQIVDAGLHEYKVNATLVKADGTEDYREVIIDLERHNAQKYSHHGLKEKIYTHVQADVSANHHAVSVHASSPCEVDVEFVPGGKSPMLRAKLFQKVSLTGKMPFVKKFVTVAKQQGEGLWTFSRGSHLIGQTKQKLFSLDFTGIFRGSALAKDGDLVYFKKHGLLRPPPPPKDMEKFEKKGEKGCGKHEKRMHHMKGHKKDKHGHKQEKLEKSEKSHCSKSKNAAALSSRPEVLDFVSILAGKEVGTYISPAKAYRAITRNDPNLIPEFPENTGMRHRMFVLHHHYRHLMRHAIFLIGAVGFAFIIVSLWRRNRNNRISL